MAAAVAPADSSTATNSAPARVSRSASSPRLDVEDHAGHLEDLRPPGDQLIAPRAALVAVIEMGRRPEGDVVGAGLGQSHSVVAGDADVDADDAAVADDAARLLVGCGEVLAGVEMHAVGTQGAGELGIAGQQRRRIAFLRKVDQRLGGAGVETGPCRGPDQHRGDGRRIQRRLQPGERILPRLQDGIELARSFDFHPLPIRFVPLAAYQAALGRNMDA